jgi:YVTN family beta-propeller protein
MSRGRLAVSSLVLCGLLLAAIPSLASARFAYVTGSDQGGGFVAPIDLASTVVGSQIPIIGGEGSPSGVAITPDGSRAYVTNTANDTVVPIDLATNTAGTPIPVIGSGPQGIAIAPNGSRAYVTDQNSNTVTVIDLASGTVIGSPIPVGGFPQDIAVTPDGTRAYVANQSTDDVSVIDLASGTTVSGSPIPVGNGPQAIAITPNGARAYVANGNDDSVSVIDLASGTVSTISSVGNLPFDIAITPNGTLAYVVNALDDSAVPLDIAGGIVGTAIPVDPFPVGIAITPNGSYAYATSEVNGSVTPIAVGGPSGTPIPVVSQQGSVSAIAIVPNQGPRAAFSSSPQSAAPGEAAALDAVGSTDSDGTVARYDWDFGDGTVAANGGASPSHTYSRAGTYTVTLTLTDNEGCSTTIVFTGQTASCNGSSAARVSHTVTIGCPRVSGSASSFVPRIRSAHVVPGVRVRLAASQPATLGVEATLLWSKEGQRRETALDRLSVRINHWLRIRLPLPAALRNDLPLGSRVRVRLRIEAKPRGDSACGGGVTHRTLKVRVVEVIPGAVQRGRAR